MTERTQSCPCIDISNIILPSTTWSVLFCSPDIFVLSLSITLYLLGKNATNAAFKTPQHLGWGVIAWSAVMGASGLSCSYSVSTQVKK
jgi:hypothetical protein